MYTILVALGLWATATPAHADDLPPRPRPPRLRDMDDDGYRPIDGDCNDRDPEINPEAIETDYGFDGLDNDCNSEVDEGWELVLLFDFGDYLSASYTVNYTVSAQLIRSVDEIGEWWDDALTSTFVEGDAWVGYTDEDWYTSDKCGVRIGYTVTYPDGSNDWYCVGGELESTPIDVWWYENYHSTGIWYTEEDFQIWEASDGGCSAILIWDAEACPL